MTTPEPSAGGAEGPAVQPVEARAFAGLVEALEQGVSDAHEALRRLGAEPLAVGSGADNAAIASWYRALVETDTVPAARSLALELDGVRQAVRQGVAAWEQSDADAAAGFREEPGSP